MKIAIVGGGLAGVALAYFLSGREEVHLFDLKGIGGGASGIAAGLVHPYPGRLALLSWMGKEAMNMSMELFHESKVPFTLGLLRLAITKQQKEDFALRAKEDASVVWWNEEEVSARFPLAKRSPGIFIQDAVAIDTKNYLQALWLLSEKRGARLIQERVFDLQRLEEAYDGVVLACGAEILDFPECANLPLKLTKGHVLICKKEGDLPYSLASNGHITLVGDFLYLGSTYEQRFATLAPEPGKGEEMKAKISAFYPPAQDFEEVELRAGVRISPHQGYRPFLKQLNAKTWVFTALGSRGLLYHAYLAKQLARSAFKLG